MKRDFEKFNKVLMLTRQYFVMEYHAGTREMIYRYVCSKTGDVPPLQVTAALRVLRDNNEIIFEKRVWWSLTIK